VFIQQERVADTQDVLHACS